MDRPTDAEADADPGTGPGTAPDAEASESPADGASALKRRWRRALLRVSLIAQPVIGPFLDQWRRSLMVRTMVLTGLITTAMILISGVAILTTIGNNLYESRKDQALDDSARATVAAQRVIDAADTSERGNLSMLFASVQRTVQDTSASQMIYVRRQPGQLPMSEAPPSYYTTPALVEALTPELAESTADPDLPQHWQAVSFTDQAASPGPGIIVASQLVFPSGAGNYDLFIGYSLSDTQNSLGTIQRTLGVTAIVLLAFVVIFVLTMVRLVFRPIRAAAAASRRLAAGESDARMPLQNDEHFDLLSENFNFMADTLQSRIEELDELSEMQQHFVSDVSHELRTPLTTIRLASEVLRSSQDGMQPAQIRAVEVLGTQVERFETLLTDLLEISRYDAGRVTLETEPTNLVTLTREVVEGLQPLSESPIEVRALGGYAPLDVDARRIRRIVSNLVGNAIEHGEGRPVLVTVDSNSAAVAIAVRDWGVGMSEEDVTRVFDRFWRADPSRKRTLGGTGLGLAIAREDAAVHGGHLEVWSRLGEGSNFRLTLPRGESSASFVSPIPLVPEDVVADDPEESSGGWLRRPKRRVRKAGSR